ncbi:MAG: FecR family protein [Cephaloticoccus sp.]|nr:FecR family protein [Cephaloticoccus sp.]MCF7759179.1 FecR family protein [Cephaloticoccus sp.]
MNKKIISWLLLFTVTSFVAASVQGQEEGSRLLGVIKVAKVTGSVTAIKDGNTIDLSAGVELTQGYVVNTANDSSVVLVFSNGATVNLAQDTSLSIDEFLQDPFADEISVAAMTAEPSSSTTKLNLSRGELVGNVKKLNTDAGSTFTVNTPVGAAGIRGTTFRIVFRPDGTGRAFFSLTTVEGNVVLASGTVNMPSEVSVPDNKEVEVLIDVTVDDVTGAVTVTAGPSTPVIVIDTPPATQAAVAATVQQVTQAVANVVFTTPTTTPTPTPTTPTPTTPTTEKPAETPPPTTNQPPPATAPTPRTTTGDGK